MTETRPPLEPLDLATVQSADELDFLADEVMARGFYMRVGYPARQVAMTTVVVAVALVGICGGPFFIDSFLLQIAMSLLVALAFTRLIQVIQRRRRFAEPMRLVVDVDGIWRHSDRIQELVPWSSLTEQLDCSYSGAVLRLRLSPQALLAERVSVVVRHNCAAMLVEGIPRFGSIHWMAGPVDTKPAVFLRALALMHAAHRPLQRGDAPDGTRLEDPDGWLSAFADRLSPAVFEAADRYIHNPRAVMMPELWRSAGLSGILMAFLLVLRLRPAPNHRWPPGTAPLDPTMLTAAEQRVLRAALPPDCRLTSLAPWEDAPALQSLTLQLLAEEPDGDVPASRVVFLTEQWLNGCRVIGVMAQLESQDADGVVYPSVRCDPRFQLPDRRARGFDTMSDHRFRQLHAERLAAVARDHGPLAIPDRATAYAQETRARLAAGILRPRPGSDT